MTSEKKSFITLFAFVLTICSTAQTSSFYDLRENANYADISMDEKCAEIQDYPKDDLNYVKTLLYTWKKTKIAYDSFPSDRLLQSLSSVGDIQNVILLSDREVAPYPQLNDTAYANKFKRRKLNSSHAKEFILKNFKGREILMFNEGHDRPQTRAFVVSILEDLKNAGVKCLAMETANERGNLKQLDGSTGCYTQEPMSGEVVREGLRLGFTLVSYEDFNLSKTVKRKNLPDTFITIQHTSNQRDSVQARNLYDRIKTKNGIEKTVVLAGYGHIAESFDTIFSTMAMNFKKISGIDPLTIEQTTLLEGMKYSPYANRLLGIMLNRDSIFAFKPKDLKMFSVDSTAYDIYIYHPATNFIHNRPSWLITSKNKLFMSVEIPKSIKPVLVQAYLADEIKSDADYKLKIPCDQTFYAKDNLVWFALSKNKKYKIVFRDDKNGIIYKTEI